MTKRKSTLAGVGVFLVLLVCGILGFCGSPTDHQTPKPSSSSSKG